VFDTPVSPRAARFGQVSSRRTILVVERVHAIDADEQHVLDAAVVIALIALITVGTEMRNRSAADGD
jgi:hypothetical protein